jgi:Leucine-rich repeat (LRR) protein
LTRPVKAVVVLEVSGTVAVLDKEGNEITVLGAGESQSQKFLQYITIKGVEYSTSLTGLNLLSWENTNADIEPLKYMVNLTELRLSANQISDISVLAGVINLQILNLNENQISDISPLAGADQSDVVGFVWHPNQRSADRGTAGRLA